jgi:hypothetical protein
MTVRVELCGRRLPSQKIVLTRALVSAVLGYMLIRRAAISHGCNDPSRLLIRGFWGSADLSWVFQWVTLASAALIIGGTLLVALQRDPRGA